jgi:predicted nucleotidyltransferase component of viral defense system
MLYTNTISEQTLVLLKQIQAIHLFKELRLVGGTSLALQLGHRESIDLDLFGKLDANKSQVTEVLKKYFDDIQPMSNSIKIHIFAINGVKVDIVDYPYEWICEKIEENDLVLASMKDIAAMKLEAITNRGTKKDFVDLYFLLQHFSLEEMLEFYSRKFKTNSSFMILRSLSYFEDADKQIMPKMLIQTDWEEIKEIIREEIRKL